MSRYTGILIFTALIVITGVSILLWYILNNSETEISDISTIENSSLTVEVESNEQQTSSELVTDSKELFDEIALQQVVDDWAANTGGTAGVVIMDESGNVISQYNQEEIFFAASIYKLYVAYAGYLELQKGELDPNAQYINGNTRVECLDLMIRESDSPCAEKMWVEIGKQELDRSLKDLGINNTSMVNITTTAVDAAKQLSLIINSEKLSDENRDLLYKSMRDQVYRDTLNKSFTEGYKVYNKIGFRELDEYHDVAIVETPDGRKLIISVLTNGVGTQKIVALGSQIEKVL